MEQKTIKIFLASSIELSDDCEKFGNFVRRLDEIYSKRGIHIKVTMWEDLDAAYKGQRQQNYYNEKVRESDLFIALFYTKGGDFTIEEFDVAVDEFVKSNKQSPKIYVYFMDLPEDKKRKRNLKKFMERLDEMGIFWNSYGNQDQLRLHFLQQLLMVENGLANLKLEGDKVTLEGMHVADIDNLPFAKSNKDYQRIIGELLALPEEIAVTRKVAEEHPDNGYLRSELQKKLNRYNRLKEEVAGLQKTLFEMSQRIAGMQSQQLRRATEAFELGDIERANTLLDDIIRKSKTNYADIKHNRELVHQNIEVFLLRAKTRMAEMNTPIEERIKQVHAIYAKAKEWAKNSALPDEKYDGLLDDYSKFLYDYGLYKEAEPVYLRLISLREKLYGKEHANTATAYNDIGALYYNRGDYAKALEYHWKALAVRERVFGSDHPNTAMSYNNIGGVYYSQGDYTKALECLGKALDIREWVLGPDHSDTATSYNNIGLVYNSQGNYAKALEYLGKALDIRERVLGPDHPSTATFYNNIGMAYHNQGDYFKAVEYYRKALDVWERVLGPDHPYTKMVKRSVELCRHMMEGGYTNTAISHENTEKTQHKIDGNTPKALESSGKALAISEQMLGSNTPSEIVSYKSSESKISLEGSKEDLAKCESEHGHNHPETASLYSKIGTIYYAQNDFDNALKYNKEALEIRKRILDTNSSEIAASYHDIGIVYARKGDNSKAWENYLMALKGYKNILDDKNGKLGHNDSETKKARVDLCRFLLQLKKM